MIYINISKLFFLDYFNEKIAERNRRIDAARQTNSLLQCPICINDEVLAEDMVECDRVDQPHTHAFCIDCARQHAQVQIGAGMC